jgi:alkanesulfonate monooxygenase SsuD/methylene tetrahydromethanopterin reductase-like flavin-dependent oxidoreductase (luciferase family)
MFIMRFGMRSNTSDPAARAAMYGAVLDMAAWSETRGCVTTVLSEHHAVDDGYLPSPVPLAAAIAARTSSMTISVAALLLALYEPVKLAEDLAIVDLVSRGRVSYVIGIGYRDEEFDMFGVDRRGRGRTVEARIGLLRRLWNGDEVEFEGRRARVTPLPYTPGGPVLAYGGGTEIAARRAARLGMFFLAENHDSNLEAAYRAEAERAGIAPLGCAFPSAGVPLTVFVADDPDQAWAEIGEYLLLDATSYAQWNARRQATASVSFARTVDELRSERGEYQIITPEEAASYAARGTPLALQPLVGGIPPDVAWRYLETAAAVVPTSPSG